MIKSETHETKCRKKQKKKLNWCLRVLVVVVLSSCLHANKLELHGSPKANQHESFESRTLINMSSIEMVINLILSYARINVVISHMHRNSTESKRERLH